MVTVPGYRGATTPESYKNQRIIEEKKILKMRFCHT